VSRERCPWPTKDPLLLAYHDQEWGVPVHDERALFEFLILEGAQAGLSWTTVLRKREGYRAAFDGFDPERVAGYGPAKVAELLSNPGIIRNQAKVAAAISNAQAFLAVQREHGSFDRFIWSFVDGAPVHNAWTRLDQLPVTTPSAERLSRELKRLGFRFIGPTIVYAHMQATGMVNDHLVSCYRYRELGGQG